MKFTETEVSQDKLILANDHYVAVPYDCSAVSASNGIIPAGTILPANDATAVGVLLHSVDKNDDPNGALIVHGFIVEDKLPTEPAAAAKTALGQITFM